MALVLAAGAFALSGCQTTGTGVQYVRFRQGPELEAATAQCKALAAKASHVVIGIGGPEVIAGALIGTAIATSIRRAQVFELCMTELGYRKAGQAAPQPAPAAAAAPQAKPKPPTEKPKSRAG